MYQNSIFKDSWSFWSSLSSCSGDEVLCSYLNNSQSKISSSSRYWLSKKRHASLKVICTGVKFCQERGGMNVNHRRELSRNCHSIEVFIITIIDKHITMSFMFLLFNLKSKCTMVVTGTITTNTIIIPLPKAPCQRRWFSDELEKLTRGSSLANFPGIQKLWFVDSKLPPYSHLSELQFRFFFQNLLVTTKTFNLWNSADNSVLLKFPSALIEANVSV